MASMSLKDRLVILDRQNPYGRNILNDEKMGSGLKVRSYCNLKNKKFDKN